jgi:hypothetical protein
VSNKWKVGDWLFPDVLDDFMCFLVLMIMPADGEICAGANIDERINIVNCGEAM